MFTYMSIDTETPTTEPRFAIEIGWAISSRGEVKTGGGLVKEVWEEMPTKTGTPKALLTAETLLPEKYVLYNSELYAAQIKPLREIAREFWRDIEQFGVLFVSAHNAPFDKRVLAETFAAYGASRFDVSKAITFDTQAMARKVLLPMAPSRAEQLKLPVPTPSPLQKLYAEWAAKAPAERMTTGPYSKPRINVETIWRFLTNNPDFVESHTAREDAEIEVKILEWLIHQYKNH